jgi:hypothetical protein
MLSERRQGFLKVGRQGRFGFDHALQPWVKETQPAGVQCLAR